ncbi:MAG: hypothetical protein F6K16_30960 [Symploca sp. SIO2B6]|nr:hypothetical protein [Symploca sp. SIO2B6]
MTLIELSRGSPICILPQGAGSRTEVQALESTLLILNRFTRAYLKLWMNHHTIEINDPGIFFEYSDLYSKRRTSDH